MFLEENRRRKDPPVMPTSNTQFSSPAASGNFNADRRFNLWGITVWSRSGCDFYIGLRRLRGLRLEVFIIPRLRQSLWGLFFLVPRRRLMDRLSQQADLLMLR